MKKLVLVSVSVISVLLFSACEPDKLDDSVVKNENSIPLKDILVVDKRDIVRPGNQ